MSWKRNDGLFSTKYKGTCMDILYNWMSILFQQIASGGSELWMQWFGASICSLWRVNLVQETNSVINLRCFCPPILYLYLEKRTEKFLPKVFAEHWAGYKVQHKLTSQSQTCYSSFGIELIIRLVRIRLISRFICLFFLWAVWKTACDAYQCLIKIIYSIQKWIKLNFGS